MFSFKLLLSAVVVIVLGIYIFDSEDPDPTESSVKIVKMSSKLSVFVLGATGEVGKEVVKELARQKGIERVTLIGRRLFDLPDPTTADPNANYSKFTQTIVDFDKLSSDHASAFEGFDVGISTLGTTRGKAGKAGFYKVDHDYVVESAKLAKSGGCKHFNLVTSASANKDSFMYYSSVKGLVEEEVTQMGFEKLTIYRPGFLLCDRTERRIFDKIFTPVARTLDRGGKVSIDTSMVAKAIVNHCLQSGQENVQILYNGQINALGKQKIESE